MKPNISVWRETKEVCVQFDDYPGENYALKFSRYYWDEEGEWMPWELENAGQIDIYDLDKHKEIQKAFKLLNK
jgi:hypothetical protein